MQGPAPTGGLIHPPHFSSRPGKVWSKRRPIGRYLPAPPSSPVVRDIVEIGWCLIDLAMPGLPLVDPARFRLGAMPGGTIEKGQHTL